jgi:hypothetical protein
MTMSAVKNSKEYWKKVSLNLNAMNHHNGPATIFGTISPAEYDWDELYIFLKQRCTDVPGVEEMTLTQLMDLEPLFVSYYFEQKFQSVWKKIITSTFGPFGKVRAFFWRREYQCRGAPHIHYKLWILGAPVYGVDPNHEVIAFIESILTCRIPDQETEPELFKYVMKYQFHKCTDSCIRVKNRKGIFSKYCRYKYPREVNEKTTLNSVDQCIRAKKNGLGNHKIYNLKRSSDEIFINDYNPILLLAWKGNVDIQYIGEQSMALDRYITTYITKAEKNATKKLWEDCNKAKHLRSKLKSFAVHNFKSREAGVYEVCDKLLGISMHEFSSQVTWVNTYPKDRRRKSIKPFEEINKMGLNDKDIYFHNMPEDYYPNRPDELEDMSLFNFMSWYDYKTKQCTKQHKDCHILKNKFGYIHKRSSAKVLKTPHIKVINPETSELFFHNILYLFRPWRNENELCSENSYHEHFNKVSNDQAFHFDDFNYRKYDYDLKRTNAANDKVQAILQEPNEIEPDNPEHIVEQHVSNSEALGVFDYPYKKVTQAELMTDVAALNVEQKDVFYKVTETIDHQTMHKLNQCQCNECPRPLRLFCSGVAGM